MFICFCISKNEIIIIHIYIFVVNNITMKCFFTYFITMNSNNIAQECEQFKFTNYVFLILYDRNRKHLRI